MPILIVVVVIKLTGYTITILATTDSVFRSALANNEAPFFVYCSRARHDLVLVSWVCRVRKLLFVSEYLGSSSVDDLTSRKVPTSERANEPAT